MILTFFRDIYAMQDFSVLIFLILSMASCGSSSVFNVLHFGAIGDGVRDDSHVSSHILIIQNSKLTIVDCC